MMDMLCWLLLRLSISAALIATVDPNCTDKALSFKVKGVELTFNTKNAKKFLSCLCNTIYGCEFRVNNTHDKIDIISAEPTSATVTSLSNVFTCMYSLYDPEILSCELLVQVPTGQCVTSFKEAGCDHIFNMINCRADGVSLTWNQPYTVTCQLVHETSYANGMCIDDKNINYTIKDCHSGAHHRSTVSSLANVKNIITENNWTTINVTLSTNNRETFITTANASEVHPIENIIESNWTPIVAVTVSLGVLLCISFILVSSLVAYMISRGRQNAESDKTFLNDVMDKGKAKMDGNVDAMFLHKYTQTNRTMDVEPYHVMQLIEIINDVEATNGKKFIFQSIDHEISHYAYVAKSEDKSVSASSLIVHSEMEKANENLIMGKIEEESGSIYSTLEEGIKDVQNMNGILQVPSDAIVSDRISPAADDQILKSRSLEPIYFELERENRKSDVSIRSDL